MKSIQTQAIITSLRSRSDGSLGLSLTTPELKPAEKTVFFELLNLNLHLLITPMDEPELEVKEVKGELDQKTPSKRLMGVIFVHWKQQGEQGDFEAFRRVQMDKIIEGYKQKNLEQL